MASTLEKIYLYFSMGIIICPLILALINVKSYPKGLKVITLYLVCIASIGAYSAWLWAQNKNNLPVLHVYTMVEFTAIMLFYQVIFKIYIAKKWFVLLIAVFLAFCLLNATCIQDWKIFNTYPRTLESILVISASLYYYYKITRQTLYTQIEKSPVFWINTGFFIYFSGSFLLFTISNYILPYSFKFNMMVWQFHAFLSIVNNILIFIGLWQHKKT
ncbi:hypothetical protein [Pedobacter gandavensis]|uniref:hypothetical protein n=1 Tax=Pedobacter gandavensis TaxID=2679963 RepID=UPI00292F74C7|nr:hypothetical protein [Pedobacter gandavensis]